MAKRKSKNMQRRTTEMVVIKIFHFVQFTSWSFVYLNNCTQFFIKICLICHKKLIFVASQFMHLFHFEWTIFYRTKKLQYLINVKKSITKYICVAPTNFLLYLHNNINTHCDTVMRKRDAASKRRVAIDKIIIWMMIVALGAVAITADGDADTEMILFWCASAAELIKSIFPHYNLIYRQYAVGHFKINNGIIYSVLCVCVVGHIVVS